MSFNVLLWPTKFKVGFLSRMLQEKENVKISAPFHNHLKREGKKLSVLVSICAQDDFQKVSFQRIKQMEVPVMLRGNLSA